METQKFAEERGITRNQPVDYVFEEDFYISLHKSDITSGKWFINVKYGKKDGPELYGLPMVLSDDFDVLMSTLQKCEKEICERKDELTRKGSLRLHEQEERERRKKKDPTPYGPFDQFFMMLGGRPAREW